ncbi:unnamed protein product [Caenorhabditis angaria]|uniref:Uncharacterized protein n=1 Tax=Caenorhabditis angaria TaxID=860376 RepID=A0A9P1MXH6_9PELO|nr:unnamed protein product [Caenorhabditis angaria]
MLTKLVIFSIFAGVLAAIKCPSDYPFNDDEQRFFNLIKNASITGAAIALEHLEQPYISDFAFARKLIEFEKYLEHYVQEERIYYQKGYNYLNETVARPASRCAENTVAFKRLSFAIA